MLHAAAHPRWICHMIPWLEMESQIAAERETLGTYRCESNVYICIYMLKARISVTSDSALLFTNSIVDKPC